MEAGGQGYDWHGATLVDVNAAVEHLEEVKRGWAKALGLEVPGGSSEEKDQRIAVVGHSNGGQGALLPGCERKGDGRR